MKKTIRTACAFIPAMALTFSITIGCSLFRSTEKAVTNIEQATEKISSQENEKGKAQPEARHEPVLVDNKVIALRIKANLKNQGSDLENIEVDADKREIVMTGTVPSAKAREKAADIARKEAGKVTVKNEIKIKN